MDTIKLVIVEDDPDIGTMMSQYLRSDPLFFSVIRFASVENLMANALNMDEPDIVMMDIMLPGKSGIQGVSEVIKQWPNTKVIMNSILKDDDAIYQSLIEGAVGYISKDTSLEAIKDAIKTVYAGGSYMNPEIARKVVSYFQKSNTVREMLNEKEWKIAMGIKQGLSYQAIADQNEMSIDGVRFYIQRIYRKLNINSRGQLTNILG